MRKLLVALLILVPLSIWAQTGPGGGTGPLFDPGSGGGGSGGGATEEVTGYVQPTNDGVGLRVRRSSDSAVVFSVDPDTGSVVCSGSPCTFTDSTGVLANTYSLAGARFYEVNPAVDTILNIQAAHTTTIGSCITIDVVNDLVELLCAGTYKISMAISAQFTATTGDECMKIIAWNETDNQLIPDGHGVLAASGRRTAASQATSLSNGGQYIITIASPIDVAVYTGACFTGTYPTTSIVGAPASTNGNAMSSIIVERVN